MSGARLIEVHLGDEVRLRKPHPCGGTDWTVVRLGADIGLTCHTCQHRILLPRSQFERRLKGFIARSTPPAAGRGGPPAASAGESIRESTAG